MPNPGLTRGPAGLTFCNSLKAQTHSSLSFKRGLEKAHDEPHTLPTDDVAFYEHLISHGTADRRSFSLRNCPPKETKKKNQTKIWPKTYSKMEILFRQPHCKCASKPILELGFLIFKKVTAFS